MTCDVNDSDGGRRFGFVWEFGGDDFGGMLKEKNKEIF